MCYSSTTLKLRVAVPLLLGLTSYGCAGAPGTMVMFGESPALAPPGSTLPHQAETMSVVVPPSPDGAPWANGCPAAGRAFVAYGDFENPNRGTALMYSDSLACLGAPGCMKDVPRALAADPRADARGTVWLQDQDAPRGAGGRCLAGPDVPGSVAVPMFPHNDVATDMMLARVPLVRNGQLIPGGRVLHFWQAFRSEAPQIPAVDTLTWDGRSAGTASCRTVLKEVGVQVRWSDDCGATWSEPKFVGFSDFGDGRGGRIFPMQVTVGDRLLIRGGGATWGTDRFEVYADPFVEPGAARPALYLAGVVVMPDAINGVPSGERRVDGLLRSDDGGESWRVAYAFSDWGGGPKVMTSTQSGRLFVGRCIGTGGGRQRLQLFWFDGRGTDLAGVAYVDYKVDGHPIDCRGIPSEELFGSVTSNVIDESLARVKTTDDADVIRVAYSGVEGRQQGVYVTKVKVSRERKCRRRSDSDCVTITPEKHFMGAEGRSVMHPHFVETDRMELRVKGGAEAPAVLSYLEWPDRLNPSAGAVARYSAVYDDKWTEITTLSLRAGVASAWAPRVRQKRFIGDYDYGSFFASPGKGGDRQGLRFFIQWPQSDPSLPGDNHVLRANVVEVVP